MGDVLPAVCALRVHLRVAGAADAEIAGLLQLPHQLDGVVVVPAAAVARLQLRRQVAPQGHDVFDAVPPHVRDALRHGLMGG